PYRAGGDNLDPKPGTAEAGVGRHRCLYIAWKSILRQASGDRQYGKAALLPNQKRRPRAPFLTRLDTAPAQLSCLRDNPIASRPLAPGTTFMWMRWPSASSLMPSRASTER